MTVNKLNCNDSERGDHLIIATAYTDTVRIYCAKTTRVVETARLLQKTWPTATAALGRVLTGTLIMGVMDDNVCRLTVEIAGDGLLGKIVAVSNQSGVVKGYLDHPEVDLDLNKAGKFDVAGAVGKGYFSVIKDLGLKGPYQGIVPLQSGEIAEDFAYYFTKSEQTPSAVALGVLVNPNGEIQVAGGLVIQLMPGATEAITQMLEAKLTKLPQLTHLLSHGMTTSQLVQEFGDSPEDVKILQEIELQYQCDCSQDRFRGPLLSLDPQELDEIIAESGELEVRCHFCNKIYHYRQSDL